MAMEPAACRELTQDRGKMRKTIRLFDCALRFSFNQTMESNRLTNQPTRLTDLTNRPTRRTGNISTYLSKASGSSNCRRTHGGEGQHQCSCHVVPGIVLLTIEFGGMKAENPPSRPQYSPLARSCLGLGNISSMWPMSVALLRLVLGSLFFFLFLKWTFLVKN